MGRRGSPDLPGYGIVATRPLCPPAPVAVRRATPPFLTVKRLKFQGLRVRRCEVGALHRQRVQRAANVGLAQGQVGVVPGVGRCDPAADRGGQAAPAVVRLEVAGRAVGVAHVGEVAMLVVRDGVAAVLVRGGDAAAGVAAARPNARLELAATGRARA